MKQSHYQTIKLCSEQIQIDPINSNSYILSRSEAFTLDGRYNQAISDLSKLILVSPSRTIYASRSELLRSQGKYVQALKDLQQASLLEKQGDTPADIFLENSICLKKFRYVQEMVNILSTHESTPQLCPYNQTISHLLEIKDLKIKQLQQQRQKQIIDLKQYYEEQTKLLQEQLFAQLQELKEKMNLNYINYQSKFEQELQESTLTEMQKMKLKVYFEHVASEMEKYYVAAKNLHKIDDKTIKFQDFQTICSNQNKPDVIRRIYKLFDKYTSKVEFLSSLIKEIPYIGSVFKVIKQSMKPFGWAEEINMKSQCQNIERIAINITAFNDFSTNLAYYFTWHFQKNIINHHQHQKSGWQRLIGKIKQLQEKGLGKTTYRYHMDAESESIKDYAIVHASVIMVAYACNKLTFDRQQLKSINKIYEKDKQTCEKLIGEIYELIDKVENSLTSNSGKDEQSKKQTNSSSYYQCAIY